MCGLYYCLVTTGQSRMWAVICHCVQHTSQCPPHHNWASASIYYGVPEDYRAINISGKHIFWYSRLYWNWGGASIAGENFMFTGEETKVCFCIDEATYTLLESIVSPARLQSSFRKPKPSFCVSWLFQHGCFSKRYTLAHNHQRLTMAFRGKSDNFNLMLRNPGQHFLYSPVCCQLSLSHCNSVEFCSIQCTMTACLPRKWQSIWPNRKKRR